LITNATKKCVSGTCRACMEVKGVELLNNLTLWREIPDEKVKGLEFRLD